MKTFQDWAREYFDEPDRDDDAMMSYIDHEPLSSMQVQDAWLTAEKEKEIEWASKVSAYSGFANAMSEENKSLKKELEKAELILKNMIEESDDDSVDRSDIAEYYPYCARMYFREKEVK